MEQAARSGKQNIAEGSAASATSKETEIKLTNAAKASLDELLLDYEDYLRQTGLTRWMADNPRSPKLCRYLTSDEFMNNPMKHAAKLNDEEYCNMCITLIRQTTAMLAGLLKRQQAQFLENGGIREKMYRARVDYRNNNNDPSQKH